MFTKRLITRLVVISLIVVSSLLSGLGTMSVYAASLTVNTDADEIFNNGNCSLREAIINANNNNQSGSTDCASGIGTDTITFAANYTITLAGAQLPAVTSPIIINGQGMAKTIIQASTCNPVTLPGGCTPATYRVFQVDFGGNLKLDALTVRHGRCSGGCTAGGGIDNQGSLTVTNSALSGNRANGSGGGINNGGGILIVTNSTFSGNNASAGGGIHNYGGLTVTDSTISGNSASTKGGGIYNYHSNQTVANSTLSGNSAANGGGIYNDNGDITATNNTLSGNSAANGGGIYNDNGALTMTNNTLSGNSAAAGGGIYNDASALTVMNSTFSGNSATHGAGIFNYGDTLIVANSVFTANSASAWGGAIRNLLGTVTVTNSTFSENNASDGGAILNVETALTVTDSTFSGNSATNDGGAVRISTGNVTIFRSTLSGNTASTGGGIYNSSQMKLANSTISGNEAYDYGGGIYSDGSASIYNSTIAFNTLVEGTDFGAAGIDGDMALYNTIVAGNIRLLTSEYLDCSGTMYLAGVNAFWKMTNCASDPASPGYSTQLLSLNELGPLQDNGGPTWTHALLSIDGESRVIDAGDNSICANSPINNLDQRGVKRPQGSRCDVGAYEYQEPPTFADVPREHLFWRHIEAFYDAGITVGCSQSPMQYCPNNFVTRAEMAVFIERALGNFAPNPSPTGMFADVQPGNPFKPFIEELYNDGITAGCGQSPLRYCPQNYVTRAEMAVFIERALGNFAPNPSATGMFADVLPGNPFKLFIEELYNDGITAGCGQSPLRYCPQNNVTRGEMAVFIVRAFGIPLP